MHDEAILTKGTGKVAATGSTVTIDAVERVYKFSAQVKANEEFQCTDQHCWCICNRLHNIWTPTATGQLVELKIVDLAEGFYFAKQPQSPTDAQFVFMEFVAQHASFPELRHAIVGIMDDMSNLSASLSKPQVLHESRKAVGGGVAKIAATEVEYILSVCRSLFDLLQEVIRNASFLAGRK